MPYAFMAKSSETRMYILDHRAQTLACSLSSLCSSKPKMEVLSTDHVYEKFN